MISIYCTADLHSNIPTAIDLFEKLAENKNKNAILIDLGDFFEGSPFFNLFKGVPEKKLVNKLYDIIIPGNHGFEESLKINKSKLKINIINANICESNKLVFKPSVVIKKRGYRFGFIGIMSPEAFNAIEIAKRKDLTIHDPYAVLKKEISKLKNKVDFLYLLSHSGVAYDKALVKEFKEFNAIISSHCHSCFKPKFINKTLIIKPPEDGKGVVKMSIIEKNKIECIIEKISDQSKLFKTSELSFLNHYLKKYHTTLRKKLFLVSEPFCLKFTNRKSLTDYIIDKLQQHYRIDICLINYTCLRDVFHPGWFTSEKSYKIMPFDNYLVIFKMHYTNFNKIIGKLDCEVKNFFCISKYDEKSLRNKKVTILTTSYLFDNVFNVDNNLDCKKIILLRDFITTKLI